MWARGLITRAASPVPIYGSSEWLALPDGPAKVAAVVVAAESWARDGDTLIERLEAEVASEREAFKAAEDAAYVARRDAWRREWGSRDYRPHPVNRRAGDDSGEAA